MGGKSATLMSGVLYHLGSDLEPRPVPLNCSSAPSCAWVPGACILACNLYIAPTLSCPASSYIFPSLCPSANMTMARRYYLFWQMPNI